MRIAVQCGAEMLTNLETVQEVQMTDTGCHLCCLLIDSTEYWGLCHRELKKQIVHLKFKKIGL